ncbi:hypothetical protein POM88_034039 [Heracleum sosnowskyi]|uniref:RWP-RK domain-containing protein n=1 Tax=Heracleum sosnowskyi TaxID=360622 RepID=A0AAD8HKN2_9APIA|nr:hypothetical protein POM88_034039 [Heracleum sosnowskyi]
MADPNRHDTSYHGPMQTSENILDETFDYSFEFSDGENILLDENVNEFGHGTSQAGPSSGVNDQSNEHFSENFNPENLNCGNPIPLLQWPVLPEPYSCSCCEVLREIIHTIDGETRKFEIHGRLGMIFHGILEICRGDMTAPIKEYQMIDFCEVPIPDVKTYLLQYCEEQTQAGYTLVKDPLLAFNEALSVGSDWNFGLVDIDEILRASPIHIVEDTGQQPEATNQPDVSEPQAYSRRRSKRKSTKVSSNRSRTYKQQRDFIKVLKVKDFVEYFNLTIDEAAEKVGICSTSFKTVLRREKFRWPCQKIKNLEENIEKRSKDLNASNPRKRASAEADIEQLKRDIESIYAPYR